MLDRALNIAFAIMLAAFAFVILVLGIKNIQLSSEVKEANNKITILEGNQNTLKAAVQLQNDSIDELTQEADRAIAKSEQALADLKPFVEEEERRILGIRGAQQSSASQDPAERLENIRQKMLKDALL